jgi:hypothetical protein
MDTEPSSVREVLKEKTDRACLEALPEATKQAKEGSPRLLVAILDYLTPRPAVVYIEKSNPIILSERAAATLPRIQEKRRAPGGRSGKPS